MHSNSFSRRIWKITEAADNHPTSSQWTPEWCNSFVFVPKPNWNVWLCLNLAWLCQVLIRTAQSNYSQSHSSYISSVKITDAQRCKLRLSYPKPWWKIIISNHAWMSVWQRLISKSPIWNWSSQEYVPKKNGWDPQGITTWLWKKWWYISCSIQWLLYRSWPHTMQIAANLWKQKNKIKQTKCHLRCTIISFL